MNSWTDRRPTALSPDRLARWDEDLAADDTAYAAAYPGTALPGCVHTVYVPVTRVRAGVVAEWGRQALAAVDTHPEQWRRLLDELSVTSGEAVGVLDARVRAKLAREPVEDLRIDLEDGFRSHRGTAEDDADEDAHAVRVARLVAAGEPVPRSWGLRIRSLGPSTRRRGLRTLDLFLSTIAENGLLPHGFVITVPKVTSVAQVEVFTQVLGEMESALGLPAGDLRFEIQVETPQTVLDADGTVPVARMIHAAGGRVSGLHFGTYDYTASLGILGAHQNLRHPVSDFAKSLMLLAAAETGVRVSDGSDNKVPVGAPDVVLDRWRSHSDGVRRALRGGLFQGWDLHPAQLPSRFAGTFAFYRDGWAEATARLAAYHRGAPGPAGVLDEPATAFALARHLAAARSCGAVGAAELTGAGGDDDVVARYLTRNTPPAQAPATVPGSST